MSKRPCRDRPQAAFGLLEVLVVIGVVALVVVLSYPGYKRSARSAVGMALDIRH